VADVRLENHHQDQKQRAEKIIEQPVERKQAEQLRTDERAGHDQQSHHHLHRARAADEQRDTVNHIGDDQDVEHILPSQLGDQAEVLFHRGWPRRRRRKI
jgi:hypothetical protein